MKPFKTHSRQLIFMACLMSMPLAWAQAQDAAQSLAERYAPGSIDTTDKAKAVLDELSDVRAEVDRFYSSQRIACFDRFFATVCMNDVREKKRAALLKIRKIEVEANALLRSEKAAERDRALAERDNRAKQQPGRSLPISGTARQPTPDMPDPSKVPAPPEVPANGKP